MTSMNRRRFLARTGAALAVAAASSVTHAADQKKVVVVWSEGTAPKNVFPDDINGAVVGGLVLGVVESFATTYIPGQFGSSAWKDVWAFAILILVLVFRPQGLLGAKVVDRA